MSSRPYHLKSIFSLKSCVRVGVIGTGLIALLAFTLPLWLGWGLKTFVPKEYFQFETYENDGWERFTLGRITITAPQVEITIDELTAPSPLNWLRHAYWDGFPGTVAKAGEVEITISTEARTKPPQTTSKQSWDNPAAAMVSLERLLLMMDRWIPSAEVSRLIVSRGEWQVDLNSVRLKDRTVALAGQVTKFPGYPFTGSINLKNNAPTATLEIPAATVEVASTFTPQSGQWVAQNAVMYQQNRAAVDVGFGDEDWYPKFATWKLGQWNINLKTTGLNSIYDLLEFNLDGAWQSSGITNSLDGHLSVDPANSQQSLPPVDFHSKVNGNIKTLEVAEFSLTAPGIQANMSDPVSFDLEDRQLTGNVRLDIDFDLGVLNFEELQGRMTGLLEVSTDSGKPVGQFNLNGVGVVIKDFAFEALNVDANLNWPVIQLSTFEAGLTGGTQLRARGSADFQSKLIESAIIEGTLTPSAVTAYAPENLNWETVTFSTEISGPFHAIEHRGSLEIPSLETPELKPVSVQATWAGQVLELSELDLRVRNEEAEIHTRASGNLNAERMVWEIHELTLAVNRNQLAQLTDQATLVIERQELTDFTLSQLALKGSDLNLSVEGQLRYPAQASWNVEAKSLHSTLWANPWLKTPIPELELKEFASRGEWEDGPVRFDATLDAVSTIKEKPIIARGEISSNGQSIHFQQLEISDAQGPWLTVDGDAPVSFHPASVEKMRFSKSDPINLELKTTDSKNWLEWLSSLSPFDFQTFDTHLNLHGTLENMGGGFQIDMVTREKPGEHGMPSTRLRSSGTIEKNTFRISSMQVSVFEEVFQVSGSVGLPVSLVTWLDDPSAKISWEDTAYDLQVPPSKLTPMRYFFPELLSTGGEIEANLKGSISGGTTGFFRIKGMNTRAVFPFGSLRDLSAELVFQKNQAQLKNISAFIGREPATISGTLDYGQWKNPTYQFTLKGKELPLIRKPGLLLRSDLDLDVSKKINEATKITGKVDLKDGLYLLNRSTLLAGGSAGGRSASTRPPYFAVDIPPLAGWELDVAVQGDRFMRVRTPAAEGVLSLEMRLQGKLREPFATGRVTFDEGSMFFPFSSFNIDYGIAELPIENPYNPSVEILGSARRFGYDLGVEITGSAYDPLVRFTSNPPLSAEQIMLMVMAGENPDGMFDYSTSQRASKLGSYLSKGLFASGSNRNFLRRLNVNSGENLSEQGKETLEIEYLLDDRFQIVGEYDEYDFWNAGLRYHILSRKARESETREPGP